MLLKRLLTAECLITLVAFEVVGWRVEVLIQSLLVTNGLVAIITLECVGLGDKTLVDYLPTAN